MPQGLIFQYDRDGNQLKKIDVSSLDLKPAGAVWDGHALIFRGDENNKLYKIDREGELIDSWDTGSFWPEIGQIAFDRKNIWYNPATAPGADLRVQDREWNIIRDVDMTPTGAGEFCFDGYSMNWISGTLDEMGKIDREGVVIRSIDISSISTDPRGITFDRKNIWFVDWQNKRLVQIDRDGKVVKAISIFPAEEVYGITFDGKNLWITGYNVL